MSRPRTLRLALAGTAGAAGIAAAVLVPFSGAVAGHTNTLLETSLDGRSEVGGTSRLAGDPHGRGEAYVFGIDEPLDADGRSTLCYVLIADKIDLTASGSNGAHIHEGQAGENGPVVARLAFPEGGQAADCLTEGETDAVAAKFPGGDDTTVDEILANPEDYYVNVHNGEFPVGAIRGQLAPQG